MGDTPAFADPIAIHNFYGRCDVSRSVDVVDVERDPDLARELGSLLAGYLARFGVHRVCEELLARCGVALGVEKLRSRLLDPRSMVFVEDLVDGCVRLLGAGTPVRAFS